MDGREFERQAREILNSSGSNRSIEYNQLIADGLIEIINREYPELGVQAAYDETTRDHIFQIFDPDDWYHFGDLFEHATRYVGGRRITNLLRLGGRISDGSLYAVIEDTSLHGYLYAALAALEMPAAEEGIDREIQ